MLLSELQNKTLINVNDGRNIGNIVDIKMDEETGNVIALIIEPNKKGLVFQIKILKQKYDGRILKRLVKMLFW